MDDIVWDAVILGTGLPECIIASGLSLKGYKVLVIDENSTYGGVWNTVKYLDFRKWMEGNGNTESRSTFESGSFYEKNYENFTSSGNSDQEEKTGRILIDLIPKVLFSRGKLVELIISCNMTNYLEFQGIEDVYYCQINKCGAGRGFASDIEPTSSDDIRHLSTNDKRGELSVIKTPFSKSDVFSSEKLSLVEKRQIMRLFDGLKGMLELHNIEDKRIDVDLVNDPFRSPAQISNKSVLSKISEDEVKTGLNSFSEFQDKWRIDDKIMDLVKYTVAFMANIREDKFNWREDFEKYLDLLLSSLNQHGCTGTPFMYPSYGTCDLIQAFSRLAAVKGAVQRLSTTILNMSLLSGEEKHWKLEIKGQGLSPEEIRCKLLVTPSRDYLNNCFLNSYIDCSSDCEERSVLCVVSILDGPLPILEKSRNENKISLLALKMKSGEHMLYNDNVVNIFQCNHHTGCCPEGYYVVYLNMVLKKDYEHCLEDARKYINCILDNILCSKDGSNSTANTTVVYRASYVYKQVINNPRLFRDKNVLLLSDPCINNNSFLLLEDDIEKSLIALEQSLSFLNPKETKVSITHKNFHISSDLFSQSDPSNKLHPSDNISEENVSSKMLTKLKQALK